MREGRKLPYVFRAAAAPLPDHLRIKDRISLGIAYALAVLAFVAAADMLFLAVTLPRDAGMVLVTIFFVLVCVFFGFAVIDEGRLMVIRRAKADKRP
jgi:hypothetical protein